MEVDLVEQQEEFEQENGQKATSSRPAVVVVDDNHPFDLDVYIASYNGRNAVLRLLHIADRCPTLTRQALALALERIKHLRDSNLYQAAINLHATLLGTSERLPVIDDSWTQQIAARNQSDRNKLEVELKTYQSNMIKESIRMAHRDLGDFYRDVGDYNTSIKHYSKCREFSSSNHHVLEMSLSILELLIEQRNYAHTQTYVYKAEAAFESIASASSTSNQATQPAKKVTASSGSAALQSPEMLKAQAKVDFANGLAHMGQGNYEKAAHFLLKLGSPKNLDNWDGKVTSASDVAIYAVLCALATFKRSAIKSQILENETFGVFLEQEPYVRELVEAYMSSRFSTVLEILERNSARHALDIHLYSHIHEIQKYILNHAIVLYFQPFATIKLSRMSAAFGLSVEELEKILVNLIQEGTIKARIDSLNKILKARDFNQRDILFTRTMKTGADIQNANRKVLLRMRLQQADIVIKAPKKARQQADTVDQSAGGPPQAGILPPIQTVLVQ